MLSQDIIFLHKISQNVIKYRKNIKRERIRKEKKRNTKCNKLQQKDLHLRNSNLESCADLLISRYYKKKKY
jgi:hypothetical protein